MIWELENIPFYWTALAHWLPAVIMLIHYPKRFSLKKTIPITSCFLALYLGYMAVTAPQNGMTFNILMMGFAGLTALHFGLLATLPLWPIIYYCTRLFLISGFMSSLSWQLYTYYSLIFTDLYSPIAQVIFMLIIYGIICLLMVLLEWPHRSINPSLPISFRTCLTTLILGIGIYILSSISYTSIKTPFGGQTSADVFNIRTLVYAIGVAMTYGGHIQICEMYVRTERDMLKSTLDAQYRNYQVEQEAVELVNRKYHDLKHQIAVLRSEVGTDRKMSYLDQLEQEIHIYEVRYKTGNQVLDTILTSKGIHCQQEQIELACVADGKLLDFISMADVSALFGNALDNAIEAVVQIPDPTQRIIDLSVSRYKTFLRIRMQNRYIGTLKTRNGFPLTTKGDVLNHGYGVKSIAGIAEKYGGTTSIKAEDGLFDLRILIPLPRSV